MRQESAEPFLLAILLVRTTPLHLRASQRGMFHFTNGLQSGRDQGRSRYASLCE